ncbi:MAG: hypothetical protein K2R98_22430 [Gemmataceae bacterium]|nr:hypothetical protein [Gemmataceae bacterium]
MTPTAPVSNKPKTTPLPEDPSLMPPDEAFWVRYSPHNEFPVSTVASICLYALLGVAVYVAIKFLLPLFAVNTDPIPIEAVAMAPGGGGGDPDGSGGNDSKERRPENVNDTTPETVPEDLKPTVPLTKLERPDITPDQFPEIDPKDEAFRYIEQKNVSAVTLSKVGDEARKQLMQGLSAPKGKGGSGSDGGKDSGRDKGVGNGTGDAKVDVRVKRMFRWTMMFDTRTGDDYRQQLIALGAMLGVPGPDGQVKIVRDLRQKPIRAEAEDLSKITQIRWVDDRADSVGPLCDALGIPRVPYVVAYFPEKLEAEMVRKEKNFRNLKEAQIQETRFRVVRRGTTFEPMVVDQR